MVTHGLVCHSIAARKATLDGDLPQRGWRNTSVTHLVGPPWRIELINCAVHLDDDDDVAAGARDGGAA